MSIARVRGRGQVTIPVSFRKQLHLDEDATVNLVLIGQTVVMAPYEARGEKLAKKFERDAKRKNISLEDLLKDLRQIRRDNNHQRYGL